MTEPVICHYCNRPAQLVTGRAIYPHRQDLEHLNFYLCASCEAYVGTHEGTTTPYGILAKRELRELKKKAHNAFDPIWKGGEMRRHEAYAWLAREMRLTRAQCHIGMFNEDKCRDVIAICRAYNANKGRNLLGQTHT